MSVHLAEIAAQHSLTPIDLLPAGTSADEFGMIDLRVSAVYDEGQAVVRDPLPEDPTHANVVGHQTEAKRKRWSRSATVLFLPTSAQVGASTEAQPTDKGSTAPG